MLSSAGVLTSPRSTSGRRGSICVSSIWAAYDPSVFAWANLVFDVALISDAFSNARGCSCVDFFIKFVLSFFESLSLSLFVDCLCH